jgi:hypothetical protein
MPLQSFLVERGTINYYIVQNINLKEEQELRESPCHMEQSPDEKLQGRIQRIH